MLWNLYNHISDEVKMNFCLCGKQAGFAHLEECPFPYYGNNESKISKWNQERDEKRNRILNPISVEALELGEELCWFALELQGAVPNTASSRRRSY